MGGSASKASPALSTPPPRALVVACSATYARTPAPPSCLSDAAALAAQLREAGWEVTLVLEPERESFFTAFSQFEAGVVQNCHALVAFFGQAGMLDGRLHAVAETVNTDRALAKKGVCIAELLGRLQRRGAAAVSALVDGAHDLPLDYEGWAALAVSAEGLPPSAAVALSAHPTTFWATLSAPLFTPGVPVAVALAEAAALNPSLSVASSWPAASDSPPLLRATATPAADAPSRLDAAEAAPILADIEAAEARCDAAALLSTLRAHTPAPGAPLAGAARLLLPRASLALGRVAAAAAAPAARRGPAPPFTAACVADGLSATAAALACVGDPELTLNAAWAMKGVLAIARGGAGASASPAALAGALNETAPSALAAVAAALARAAHAPPSRAAAAAARALAAAAEGWAADSGGAAAALLGAGAAESLVSISESNATSDGPSTAAALSCLASLARAGGGAGRPAVAAARAAPAAARAAAPDGACGRAAPGAAAALTLLRVLASEAGAEREAVAATGGLAAACCALRAHPHSQEVAEAALWLVSLLTAPGSGGGAARACAADVEACVAAMRAFPASAAVQGLSARCVRNLTASGGAQAVPPATVEPGFLGALAAALHITPTPAGAGLAPEEAGLAARRGAAAAAGAVEALEAAAARHGGSRFVAAAAAEARAAVA